MRQIHSGFSDYLRSLLYASSGAIDLLLCAVEARPDLSVDPRRQASASATKRTVTPCERCDRQDNGCCCAEAQPPGSGEVASFRYVAHDWRSFADHLILAPPLRGSSLAQALPAR